jgi:hypothetical protein
MNATRAREKDHAKTMLENPQPHAAERSAEAQIIANTTTPNTDAPSQEAEAAL